MAICIRRAKEEDAEAIGRILFEVHAVHHAIRPDLFLEGKRKYDEGEVKALIDRTPVLVAEEAGEVLGYAVCFLEETKGGSMAAHKTLYLDDLCVDEAFRKRGVGRRLLRGASRREGFRFQGPRPPPFSGGWLHLDEAPSSRTWGRIHPLLLLRGRGLGVDQLPYFPGTREDAGACQERVPGPPRLRL